MAVQSEPTDARRRDDDSRHRYFGSLNEDGAKKVAREFAADILAQFGGKSLAGTKILFRLGPHRAAHHSRRKKGGVKEIWSMDYDGSNQRQLTNYKSLSMTTRGIPRRKDVRVHQLSAADARRSRWYDGSPNHDPFRRNRQRS